MRRSVVGLVALIAFGALGGYVAGAVTRPATADGSVAGSLAEVAVVRSGPQSPVDVTSGVTVSGAELVVSVPSGRHDLFDVRFSGVVSYPAGPSTHVAVDVTVEGIAMPPSQLSAWPSAAASPIPFQLERVIGPLASGTYRIGIQMTGASASEHRPVQLLGWTLVAQRTSDLASPATAAV
jgi:hypothetical protein